MRFVEVHHKKLAAWALALLDHDWLMRQWVIFNPSSKSELATQPSENPIGIVETIRF
jgi:hypothetical protein